MDGGGEVEWLQRAGFGLLLELGGGENLEDEGRKRDEDAGGAREAEERAQEVEAEWEVLCCGEEPDGAEGHLDEWVDERAERGVAAEGCFGEGVAVGREDAGPEVEGVHVLPVVDGCVGLLFEVVSWLERGE